MKNLFNAVLAFGLLVMVGCGGTSANVSGDTYETEQISVVVPKGWKTFPYYPLGMSIADPGQVGIHKGAEELRDQERTPGIFINRNSNKNVSLPGKAFYHNAEDIKSFKLGNYEWVGFKANSGDVPTVILKGTGEDHAFLLTFFLEMDGKKISLDDNDVKAIIKSITSK